MWWTERWRLRTISSTLPSAGTTTSWPAGPGERTDLDDCETGDGWQEITREPSLTNPGQRKPRVLVKQTVMGDEVHILCRSDGREAKDQAVREKHEQRLLGDLRKLQACVATGKPKSTAKIHKAIGAPQGVVPAGHPPRDSRV